MTGLDDAAMAVQVVQARVQDYERDDNFVTYFLTGTLFREI